MKGYLNGYVNLGINRGVRMLLFRGVCFGKFIENRGF